MPRIVEYAEAVLRICCAAAAVAIATAAAAAAGEAVMMGWEAPLMKKHAAVICGQGGGHYLNVGFGLGIVDTEIQVRHLTDAQKVVQPLHKVLQPL